MSIKLFGDGIFSYEIISMLVLLCFRFASISKILFGSPKHLFDMRTFLCRWRDSQWKMIDEMRLLLLVFDCFGLLWPRICLFWIRFQGERLSSDLVLYLLCSFLTIWLNLLLIFYIFWKFYHYFLISFVPFVPKLSNISFFL